MNASLGEVKEGKVFVVTLTRSASSITPALWRHFGQVILEFVG